MNTPVFARIRSLALAVAVAATAAVGFIVPAHAEYTESELDAFVTAAITVESLAERWIPRIKDAKSQDAAAELRSQANVQVQQAINGIEGMSVDQYTAINEAARQDQQLAERIVEIYRSKKVR